MPLTKASAGVLNIDDLYGFRNRIINGDMRIDQRNAGASANSPSTASLAYTLDRWEVRGDTEGVFSIQQNSSAPAGFVNSLKITVTTIDSSLGATQLYNLSQKIEGYNVADLNWGTANAKTVTLSFWVRSSVTGTFGGALRNSASNRSYPFTYTISVADTWEQKTVTVAGDTTGTWLTTNGLGINLSFSFGSGADRSGTAGAWVAVNNSSATGATNLMATLNATWYITGVQLEVGSVATPFERRPYGTELMLCYRYCFRYCLGNSDTALGIGSYYNSGTLFWTTCLPTNMRGSITATIAGGTNYYVFTRNGADDTFDSPILNGTNSQYNVVEFLEDGGLSGTGGDSGSVRTNNASASIVLSAEL